MPTLSVAIARPLVYRLQPEKGGVTGDRFEVLHEDLYWKTFQEKIAASTTKKKAKGADQAMDFAGSDN